MRFIRTPGPAWPLTEAHILGILPGRHCYLLSMAREFMLFYSRPIVLSMIGFMALIFPFIAYAIIGGMGWDYHKSFWFAPISYVLTGLSVISALLPFANLFFLIRFGLNEPKELKSHFVNFTCFLINLLGAVVFGSVAYLIIRYS